MTNNHTFISIVEEKFTAVKSFTRYNLRTLRGPLLFVLLSMKTLEGVLMRFFTKMRFPLSGVPRFNARPIHFIDLQPWDSQVTNEKESIYIPLPEWDLLFRGWTDKHIQIQTRAFQRKLTVWEDQSYRHIYIFVGEKTNVRRTWLLSSEQRMKEGNSISLLMMFMSKNRMSRIEFHPPISCAT